MGGCGSDAGRSGVALGASSGAVGSDWFLAVPPDGTGGICHVLGLPALYLHRRESRKSPSSAIYQLAPLWWGDVLTMAIRVWSSETSWCEVGLSGPCASQVKTKKDRIAHNLHNMLC